MAQMVKYKMDASKEQILILKAYLSQATSVLQRKDTELISQYKTIPTRLYVTPIHLTNVLCENGDE